MIPEYLTWQVSGHSQFQCKDCHRESGVINFFRYQGRLFKEMLFFRAGGGAIKSINESSFPDSACLKCHSENRKYSTSSDTIIPHQKHINKGISCVACHAGAAHGRIVERGTTGEIPVDEWNMGVATEQMEFKYTTPRMAICLDCHGKRQVTEKCSVCHSKQIVPASHKSGDFERQHGLTAQKDFKPCNLCHSYSLKKSADLTAITVPDYIKMNSFCFNCHLKKPSTHQGPGFGKVHGELAKSRGLENCLGCHTVNKEKLNKDSGPINKVYCNKCHWFK